MLVENITFINIGKLSVNYVTDITVYYAESDTYAFTQTVAFLSCMEKEDDCS